MQKTKFIGVAIATAMLCLTVTTLFGELAQAGNRTVSMFRYRCAGNNPGRLNFDEEDVSVGRAVYRSLLYLRPTNGVASVACRIAPDNSTPRFQSLQLEFGMLDGNQGSPPNIVNVYLDGRQAATQTVGPSQKATLSLNVTNVSNVAIETSCASRFDSCGRLYIWKADLQRVPDPREIRF